MWSPGFTNRRWFWYLLLNLTIILPAISAAENGYQGWAKSVEKKTGVVTFRPAKLSGQDDVLVKYYPANLLEGQSTYQWLLQKLNSNQAPRGKWSTAPEVVRQTANFASGRRSYQLPNGQKGMLHAIAFSADRQYVRLGIAVYTLNNANKPYQKKAADMLGDIIKVEKNAALSEGRGHDIETSPPKVKGIKTGVPIKPGRYVGTKTKGNKVIARYEVVLYENGEFEFLQGSMGGTIISRGDTEGFYTYSQLTGRMQMGDGFRNSSYDPNDEYCVYGIDQKIGKHLIYAAEGYLSRKITRLYWTNEDKRLSPSLRKKAKKLKNAEKNRYKHTTNPGDGIQPDQIEAVLYTAELKSGIESGLDTDAYLLMKDGRVMDGVPVAPDMLDVSRSRSREPDRWGWWKKEGDRYRFAWDVDRKHYVIPRGGQVVARPIPAGTRLEGKWSNSSSFASLDVSIVNFSGVKLDKNGRSEKYNQNM